MAVDGPACGSGPYTASVLKPYISVPRSGACWSSGCQEERTIVVAGLRVINGTKPVPGLMRQLTNGVVEWRGWEHLVAWKMKWGWGMGFRDVSVRCVYLFPRHGHDLYMHLLTPTF